MISHIVGWSVLMAAPVLAQEGTASKTLRLGLVKSLFRSMPESTVEMVSRPLQELLQRQAGLKGQLQNVGEAGNLGKMLHDGKLDLVVFHGFEFAWVKEHYPDLVPLILVHNAKPLQACLIVRKGGRVQKIEDLKDQYVAVPVGSRAHCLLFLERRCCPSGQKPEKYFKKITSPVDVKAAMDDLNEDLVSGVVVERGAYEDYCRTEPKRAGQLKVLAQSETFPSGLIAYHAGKLPAEIVRRLREGMLNAHQSKEGKELLETCRMAGFEKPPADFVQSLHNIAKTYPEQDTPE